MAEKFEQWAILEIMGHQRYAGLVSEQAIGGASFVRIDVPECDGKPPFTKMFGAGSIYAITPVAEDVARSVAKTLHQQPISVWDLPEDLKAKLRTPAPALTGPAYQDDNEYDDNDEDL